MQIYNTRTFVFRCHYSSSHHAGGQKLHLRHITPCCTILMADQLASSCSNYLYSLNSGRCALCMCGWRRRCAALPTSPASSMAVAYPVGVTATAPGPLAARAAAKSQLRCS